MTSVRGAVVERALIRRGTGQSVTVTLFILTGVFGRSFGPRGVFEIASTTSIPAITLPNTGCLEFPGENQSRNALWTVLMKNWLLPVFGPAFAIDKVPRSFEIFASGRCSSL